MEKISPFETATKYMRFCRYRSLDLYRNKKLSLGGTTASSIKLPFRNLSKFVTCILSGIVIYYDSSRGTIYKTGSVE